MTKVNQLKKDHLRRHPDREAGTEMGPWSQRGVPTVQNVSGGQIKTDGPPPHCLSLSNKSGGGKSGCEKSLEGEARPWKRRQRHVGGNWKKKNKAHIFGRGKDGSSNLSKGDTKKEKGREAARRMLGASVYTPEAL